MKRIKYKGFFISTTKLPTGDWTATLKAIPEERAMATAGPGEGHALGEFDSEEAAVDDAKKYIDDRREQRLGRP